MIFRSANQNSLWVRILLWIILIALLTPVFLAAYIIIHELGHTLLARLLGDPGAVFHLIKIEKYNQCLGCTDYDVSRLSWAANLAVTVGGVLSTQVMAVMSSFLLRVQRSNHRLRTMLSVLAFSFFFDAPFQLYQALTYNGMDHTWPTSVDYVDAVLLLQMKLSASDTQLNGLLLLLVMLYLIAFVRSYWCNRMVNQPLESKIGGNA